MKKVPAWAQNLLGTLVRHWGALLLSPFIVKGILTEEQLAALLDSAVPDIVAWIIVLGIMLWSFIKAQVAKRRETVALTMPAGSTEEQLEKKITGAGTAKISTLIMLVLVVGVVAVAPSCAGFSARTTDAQAALANLDEYQAEQLKYVTWRDSYVDDQYRMVSLRSSGKVTDAAWERFMKLQARVAQLTTDIAEMREAWDSGTAPKPLSWDARMLELYGEISGLGRLVDEVTGGN